MIRFKLNIIMSFLLFVFSLVVFAKDTKNNTVTVRVSNYPPYTYQDKSGKWMGLEVEQFEKIAGQAGLKIEFVQQPWSRSLVSMKQGTLDIMLQLSRTAEREKYINYLGILRYEVMSLVVRKENVNLPIKNFDDLISFDKKFGIQQDSVYSKEFNKRLLTDKEFRDGFQYIVSGKLNFRKTNRGRILGFFESKLYVLARIKNNPKFKDLVLHSFQLTESNPIWAGASKKMDKDKYEKLQKAYNYLEKKGIIQATRDKWLKQLTSE